MVFLRKTLEDEDREEDERQKRGNEFLGFPLAAEW